MTAEFTVETESPEPPLFQVVAGNPTPEEVAALAVVLLGLRATDDGAAKPAPHRSWIRRSQLRLGPLPGPGSWRRSALR